MKIVLAADLGGTNLRVAAINENGNICYQTRTNTPKQGDADKIVELILKLAEENCRAAASAGEVSGFTVAVPGTVNPVSKIISNAPNVPALENFPLAVTLSNKLNLPVDIENDANAAAVGENWLGASKGFQNSICVTLGTGVGGGIIIDGKILRGVDGTAAEIGHICVEPNGVLCGCSSYGCVEQYSSAQAIVRLTRQLESRYPESSLRNEPDLTSLDIYNAGKNGDSLALEVFLQQGYYLGVALAGLINVLNPEVIVIGGGAAAGSDLFMPHLLEQVNRRAYRQPVKRVKIVLAQCGDNAGILGAAKLALDGASLPL